MDKQMRVLSVFRAAEEAFAEAPAELKAQFAAALASSGRASLDVVEDIWRTLESGYAEKVRAFHTQRHIAECLHVARHYAAAVGWPALPRELELAIWFHDVVYVPGAQDNEEKSAEHFSACARRAGLDAELVAEVEALILDTKHHTGKGVILSGIMSDCDLWILGSSPERYEEYAGQVRKEHQAFSDSEYRKGRARFLDAMLRREHIYINPLFDEAFGERARENMRNELDSLQGRAPSTTSGTTHGVRVSLPGIDEYYVVVATTPEHEEDVASLLVAAHKYARAKALERYGDADCYSVMFNGKTVSRRSVPHVHVILARTRAERRLKIALLYLKRPLRKVAKMWERAGRWSELNRT